MSCLIARHYFPLVSIGIFSPTAVYMNIKFSREVPKKKKADNSWIGNDTINFVPASVLDNNHQRRRGKGKKALHIGLDHDLHFCVPVVRRITMSSCKSGKKQHLGKEKDFANAIQF
jgi:hypothetical protein